MKHIIALLCIILGTIGSHVANAAVVSAIEIEGISRIERSAIMFYLRCKVGDDLTEEGVNGITKRLYSTGYFANISINIDSKGVMKVVVLENPTISTVVLQGVTRQVRDALQKELQTKIGTTYSKDKIYVDMERIKAAHWSMGYFETKVTPLVKVLDDHRVEVKFDIDLGRMSKMRDVILIGNKFFSDKRVLENTVNKSSNWLIGLFTKGFNENSIYTDTDVITALYLEHGFLDFTIDRIVSEYHRDSADFTASIFMTEGTRYKIGDIKVVYDTKQINLDKAPLAKLIKLDSGDWYARSKVDVATRSINEYLNNIGMAFCKTEPRTTTDKEEGKVDVAFVIRDVHKIYISNINVIGGVNTSEDVIRRELLINEGSLYSARKVQLSKNRLLVTGLFDAIDIIEKPSKDGHGVDIDIIVKERTNTMALGLSAGYSTFEGLMSSISLSEANVLGRGYAFGANLILSMFQKTLSLMVTKPHVFGSHLDVTVGVDMSRMGSSKLKFIPFGQRMLSFRVSGRYPIADLFFHDIGVSASTSSTWLYHGMGSMFSNYITGDRSAISLNNALIYDSRDHPLLPTRGMLLTYRNEYAGFATIGNQHFMRHDFGTSFYHGLDESRAWVLNLTLKGGIIHGMNGKDVEYPYRYVVGMFNMRGFTYAGIGPRVVEDINGQAVPQGYGFRSNQYFVGTLELRTPTPLPREYGFNGVVFCDFGTSFGLDGPKELTSSDNRREYIVDSRLIRVAAGVGLLWISPLGPMRAEYSYPLVKEWFDVPMQFRLHLAAEPLTG